MGGGVKTAEGEARLSKVANSNLRNPWSLGWGEESGKLFLKSRLTSMPQLPLKLPFSQGDSGGRPFVSSIVGWWERGRKQGVDLIALTGAAGRV